MSERQQMIKKIQMCDFAVTDVTLYLDGHPNCPHGLAFYKEHKKMLDEAVAMYEKRYGPLTNRSDRNLELDKWTWTQGPWPWELEG